MKKLIFILFIALASCSGMDSYKVKYSIQEKFPDAHFIYSPPGDFHTFIILDKDSTLLYVQSDGLFTTEKINADIISKLKKDE